MKAIHHQFRKGMADMSEESSVALQPRSGEAIASRSHETLHRVEQDGKVLLVVSLAAGLALWLASVVTWLFTPPDQETDY